MRHDRFEYGMHRSLTTATVTRPVSRLRRVPPVYAYGARMRYWAALGLSLFVLACEYGKHAL